MALRAAERAVDPARPAEEQQVGEDQREDQCAHALSLAGIEAREQRQPLQHEVIGAGVGNAQERRDLRCAAAREQQPRPCPAASRALRRARAR